MGISYSTAKWLVGHQNLPDFVDLKYADSFARRQRVSSTTLQPSSMACSPLPTCWMSITQICLSGAPCPSLLVASSSLNSCSSSRGSTACTSSIPRNQSSAPNWTRSVCFSRESLLTLGTRLTDDRSGLRALLLRRQPLHKQYVVRLVPALDHWLIQP